MAKSHYNADSGPLPPPRLLYLVRSVVTGTHRRLWTARAEAYPTTPSSIG
jgi:hypothetical protein